MATLDAAVQAKRRAKISAILANSTRRTNQELLRLFDDPEQRASLGLVEAPIEFIEMVLEHISSTVRRLETISRKHWGVQVPTSLDLRVVVNFRGTLIGRSNAGIRNSVWRSKTLTQMLPQGPCINLNGIWYAMHRGEFAEYRFIHRDPQIGDLETQNWREYLEILLAHEFAHILDFIQVKAEPSCFPAYSSKRVKGHGINWQTLYRHLRISLGRVRIASPDPETIHRAALDAARKCLHCEGPILAMRSDAKFCSAKCRVYHGRQEIA